MKSLGLKLLLAASLLVNAGAIVAAWTTASRTESALERRLFGSGHGQIPDRLGLDAAQRERWHAMEAAFVGALQDSGREIEDHRARLVHAIMSERPEPAVIERERDAIFALQQAQQRAVIAQLLEEREMLNPAQRAALAALLLSQGAAPGAATPPGR